MTKTQQRQKAKNTLLEALAVAYYKLDDDDEFEGLPEQEKAAIYRYIDQYGKTMAKSIGERYWTA